MRITLGRFIKKAGDYDSENIICPIENYDRDKYLNRRILIRILFILLYGFGFGYMLAIYDTTIHEIKVIVVNFIIFYILSFYLIQIPHEFIHTLFYKNTFKNTNNSLVFFNKKRIVTSELNEEIHPALLCFNLIMPFILFSLLPLIAIECLGEFDLYLYSLSFANAILSSDDLLNIILQFFVKTNENGYKRLFIIPNNYDYLIENEILSESNNIKAGNIEENFVESTVKSELDNEEDNNELSNDINNELEILDKNDTKELNIDNNEKTEDVNIDINEEIEIYDSNVNKVELEFNDHIEDIVIHE
ncbi:MAG: metalloprotease family protein [Clostridium sp.]|nr:metalloprotease family protein [Clostridium sp.]